MAVCGATTSRWKTLLELPTRFVHNHSNNKKGKEMVVGFWMRQTRTSLLYTMMMMMSCHAFSNESARKASALFSPLVNEFLVARLFARSCAEKLHFKAPEISPVILFIFFSRRLMNFTASIRWRTFWPDKICFPHSFSPPIFWIGRFLVWHTRVISQKAVASILTDGGQTGPSSNSTRRLAVGLFPYLSLSPTRFLPRRNGR